MKILSTLFLLLCLSVIASGQNKSKDMIKVTTDITDQTTCVVEKLYYNPTSLVNWVRNSAGLCKKITAGGTPGNVAGPASSTDNAVTRFDSTTGKIIQNSPVTIDDNGSVNIPTGQTYKINNIALAKGDIGLGNADNTSDANKPLSTAQQTALDLKQNTITFGTGVQTALGVNVGSAGAPVVNGGALGTPSSGNGANLSNVVNSAAGTANQVNVSATTGAVTFSLPQSIATSSTPQFERMGLGAVASGSIPLFINKAVDGNNSAYFINASATNGFGLLSETADDDAAIYSLRAVGGGRTADFTVGSNGVTTFGSITPSGDALSITPGAAGAGIAITALSSGSNSGIVLTPKGTGAITSDGNFSITVAKTLSIASGTNQRAGNATLTNGTVTVSNTTVTANTIVMLTRKTASGTLGAGGYAYSVSAGTSFTINSVDLAGVLSALDGSTISYILVEVP